MHFRKDKYINLIEYILTKCSSKPHFGKTVLCSLLYFIDFNYYEVYNQSITNETYIKSKKGIKPKHFHEITNDLISKKQLYLKKQPYYNRTIHKYYLSIIPSVKFSPQELEIINLSLKRLSNNNATSMTRYAIKDPPINEARIGENLNIKNVKMRNRLYSVKKNK